MGLVFAILGHTTSPQLVDSFRCATGWWASGEQDTIVTGEGKSRRNVDVPLPGMIDHPGSNLDEPPDDRVYGWFDALKTISNIASQNGFKITEKILTLLANS